MQHKPLLHQAAMAGVEFPAHAKGLQLVDPLARQLDDKFVG
jgi:hypothetical protein